MLDSEIMTPPPPTPFEVLKVLVDVYGPPPNPDNPFHNTRQDAINTLATQMLVEAFGTQDPLSRLALIWLADKIQPYPSEDDAHLRLEEAVEACRQIQQSLELTYEAAQ